MEWWWPSLWGQVLLLAITCGALYPACQWAACQGQMARKGVSCIVSSSSTPGQGRLCRRGTDESISSLDHGLLAPTDGCLSGSLHGVRSAGGGRGSVIVCSSKAGSRLSCGCYGGVDQIWPSEIPARFSGHSSLPDQPEPPGQGWIQVCVKEPDTFTCKLASVSSPLSSSSSYLWPGRIFPLPGCLRLGLGPADLA